MAGDKKELLIIIKAKDAATKTLQKVKDKLKSVAQTMGKVLKTGALIGAAAVAALGAASVKMALDFEKSFAEVTTLLPDMDKKGIGVLREGILSFSKDLGIATSQAVPALYQAISASVPPDNVMEFMKTAAKASIGGVTDLDTAVDGLTSVVNAYGGSVISAQRASDIMFTAVKLGKTTMGELSGALFNVVPIAAATGIQFEEIAAALAALTAQGVPTTVATTQLRAAVQAMSAPTVRQTKVMGELGLSFSAAELREKGLLASFREAIDATGGNMAILRKLIGSVEGLQAVLALGGEQSDIFQRDLDAMADSAGATDKAFETMADTAGFKLQKAINNLKVTMTEVGLQVLPLLASGLEAVLGFMDKQGPAMKEFVEGFGSFAHDAGPIVVTVLEGIHGFLGEILPPIQKVGELLGGWPRIIGAVAAAFIAMKLVAVAAAMASLVTQITAVGAAMMILKVGPLLAVTAAFLALPSIINAVKNSFSDADEKIEAFNFGMESAAEVMSDTMVNPAAQATGAVIKLREEIENMPDALRLMTSGPGVGTLRFVEQEFENVGDAMAGVVQSMRDHGGDFNDAIVLVNEASLTNIQPVIDLMNEWATSIFEPIEALRIGGATAEEVYAQIAASAAEKIPKVKNLVMDMEEANRMQARAVEMQARANNEAWASIREQVVKDVDLVSGALQVYLEDGEAAFEGVKDSIKSVLPTVDEEFSAWAERLETMAENHRNFQSNLGGIYDTLVEMNVENPENIIRALRDAGPEVTAAMSTHLAENPVAAVEGVLSDLSTIVETDINAMTRAVIENGPGFEAELIATGVAAKLGFENAANGLTDSMILEMRAAGTEIRETLDARSPSRVFMKIGEDVREGFDRGVANIGPTGRVLRRSGVEGLISGASGGSAGGGANVNITIHALDGESVKRVVPEIARELDKHQRNTGGGGLI